MKKFLIDSIKLENCVKSNEDDLNSLQICDNCSKLPLPAYRSSKKSENSFCKTCFISLNFNLEHLIFNTKPELKLLERLVFSCKNYSEGCEREFKLGELDQLMFHQEKCDKKIIVPLKKCKHRQCSKRKNKAHNCLLKFSNDIDQKMNQLIEMFSKKIDYIEKSNDFKLEQQRISFQKQFQNLQKINKKQQDNIIDTHQNQIQMFLNNLENSKQLINLESDNDIIYYLIRIYKNYCIIIKSLKMSRYLHGRVNT